MTAGGGREQADGVPLQRHADHQGVLPRGHQQPLERRRGARLVRGRRDEQDRRIGAAAREGCGQARDQGLPTPNLLTRN